MAEKYPPSLVFNFDHPFATDLIPQERQLTHFTRAQNGLHEANGAFHKAGGSTRINSTAITAGPNVMGMFDYWKAGTGGTFAQKFMAVTANQKIYKEDMDGTFDDITGAVAITADCVPVFCVFDDILTIFTSAADTPVAWSQTGNAAALSGSPHAGIGAVEHANRLWVWGTKANPSRLYYSAYGDPETWSGTDTGFLDIAVNDGDKLIGAVSYKGNLVLFKGPNKGSIHLIEGLTPADFTHSPHIIKGIALQTQNGLVPVGDDVWFPSRRGIHSLTATFQTGNYAQADLSRYQHKFFRNDISLTATNLARVWGVNYADKSCAMWTFTQAGQTDPAIVFGISYITPDKLKPFVWTQRSCFSAANRINPTTGVEEVVFGTTDGFCERQDTSARLLGNSNSYPFLIETPQIILAAGGPRGDQPVTLERAYLKSQPVGPWNVNLSVERDGATSEEYAFDQGTTSFLLGTDVLGTGVLGGAIAQTQVARLTGTCRAVKFTLTQNGASEDANLFEFGVDYSPIATSNIGT